MQTILICTNTNVMYHKTRGLSYKYTFMQKILIIIISFVIGFFSYPIIFNEKTNDSPEKTTAETAQNETVQANYTFKGEGKDLLGPMRFNHGLVLLRTKNLTGKNDTFSVYLNVDKNKNGKIDSGEGWTGINISVGYETAENFDGTIAFKANSGDDYFVSVDGGRWEITATEIAPLGKNADKFKEFKGTGMKVSKPFYLSEGEHVFEATNVGSGVFSVRLADENGNFTGYLVNQIGNYDDSFKYKVVFPGNYVFVISGNNWSINEK